MAWTGFDVYAIRRTAQLLGKHECVGEPARTLEYLGMRHDTNEPAQDQIGNRICLVAVDDALEPRAIGAMVRCILPMCIDEDVDIGEDHFKIPSGRGVRPNHPSPRLAGRHRP